MQRTARHHGHVTAVAADEILRQLGQQLSGRRLIGPVGTIEEADFHAEAVVALARSALYHSIVRIRPVRKSVLDAKPKPSRARETSRLRRGWPSGFVRSKVNCPVNPVSSAMSP